MKSRDIFISHHSLDTDVAKKLKKCLQLSFLDQMDIFLSIDLKAGADWFSEITKALMKKPITVVITTLSSVKRPWIWFEVGASWNAGGAVIPFSCKGMTSKNLPDPLRRITSVNLTMRGMYVLLETIAEECGCTLDRSMAKAAINKSFGKLR